MRFSLSKSRGFKALKQSVKVSFKLQDYDSTLKYYIQLLGYTKSAVTRNTSEKSINSILDYVSAAQDMSFMEKVYSTTLNSLQEQKNDVWRWCSFYSDFGQKQT